MDVYFFLSILYLFIPAYIANGSPPVIAKLFPRWKTPMDFGKSWHGRRILGDHKTWRGTICGILLGGAAFLLQKYHGPQFLIDYTLFPWWYGFLLAAGALIFGDALKSFIKRRIKVAPGKSWIPFDQIDYTIGAFLATFWIFWPGWIGFFFLLIVNGGLSLLFHFLASTLHLTDERI